MTEQEWVQRAERIHEIIQRILAELVRAEHLHPIWPAIGHRGDHVWAAAITMEERGELQKAALNFQAHGRGSIEHMCQEAEHLGAMAVRFLLNVDAVERQRINEEARQDLQEEHNIYPQSKERIIVIADGGHNSTTYTSTAVDTTSPPLGLNDWEW